MSVLSLCGPESGLPKNPSVSSQEHADKGCQSHCTFVIAFSKQVLVLTNKEKEMVLSVAKSGKHADAVMD